MDATKEERADLLFEDEGVTPFVKSYDAWTEEGRARAQRDIAEWGRTHCARSFDPRSGVLTINFRLHPDDRWRAWERVRKARIVGAGDQ